MAMPNTSQRMVQEIRRVRWRAANWLTKRVLLRGVRRLLRATLYREAENDAAVRMAVIPRLANVVPALVLYVGVDALPDLPHAFVTVVRALCQAFVVLTVALSVARALDVANREYERRPEARQKPIKGYLQVAKIVVFVVAGISIFATLIGAKFVHVLTGLGAMTAVILLIFQDTILSFVASVQIGSDGRVRVGDWIEMPGQNADGEVTDIALHTVTVQNWDKTITTIPTKKLISDSFKNWRGMTEAGGRRIKRALEAMHHDALHEQRDANDNGEKDNLPYERRRVDVRENVLHHASRWSNGSWEAMILSRMRQRDSPFVSSSAASGMASGAKRLDVRPLFMASTSAFPPDGTTLSALWHGLVPQ